MKMQLTVLCVLALVASCHSAKPKSSNPEKSNVALLSNIPLKHEPHYQALEGNGGGLDVLESQDKGEKLYRPWKTRFDLQPFDARSPDFLKPENRMAYRRFYAANPNLALGPNSIDRHAQSTVEMMFGLTALLAIIGGILIVNGLQVLDMTSLDLVAYQKVMMRVVALAALPWLVLGAWLVTVAVAGLANPMRDSTIPYFWQCSAMSWFLLVAPIINTAFFIVHALWVSRLFFNVEQQASAPMGRMFGQSAETQKLASSDRLTNILNIVTGAAPRHAVLFLEAMCAVFGYMFITFRYGSNSQQCQPEVYWATTAFVVANGIIIVFTALAWIFSVIISVYSISPWVQDFAGSFRSNDLKSKAAEYDEKDAMEEQQYAWEQAAAAGKIPEPEVNEWDDFQQGFEEERRQYDEIAAGHARYQETVGEKPPVRPLVEAEDPLVIWADDDDSSNLPVPQTMQASMNPSAQISSQFATIVGAPSSPFQASRVFNSGPITDSPFQGSRVFNSGPITNSMVVLNNQIDNPISPQQWPSQGFAMPFAQRPNSAPILTTGQLAPTASTIYTPQPQFGNSI